MLVWYPLKLLNNVSPALSNKARRLHTTVEIIELSTEIQFTSYIYFPLTIENIIEENTRYIICTYYKLWDNDLNVNKKLQKLVKNQKCWYLFTWTLLTSSAAFDNNLILLCYTWKRSLLIKFWIIIESICAFFLFQVNGQRWPGGTNPGPHSSTWGQSKWHRDVERVDFFFERKTFPDRIKIFFFGTNPKTKKKEKRTV